MRNLKCYYSNKLTNFLRDSDELIIGTINSNSINADITIQQQNAWKDEIRILKDQLRAFDEGHIVFEYTIPREGKRVDVVFLHKNIVFLLEFKCGEDEYKMSAVDQVLDYALDLRNFQKESHNKLLVPIVVSTNAPATINDKVCTERIYDPFKANKNNISSVISEIASLNNETDFNYEEWVNSTYLPTPTIVEAAQALYRGHRVEEITRSDADTKNLSITSKRINEIIDYSKLNKRKSICFVTGVPGAGKTLIGLNLAIERTNALKGEHAMFLSGNFPLVAVLQEALARDKVEQEKQLGRRIRKDDALRETSSFIKIIHLYRDSFINNNDVPPEHVVIFDEAQRAWTKRKISNFMQIKKGVPNFQYSEPEFLISTMNRQKDWGVVVCLVGGGQEINDGEAGLPEWFDSLKRSFNDWDVYVTSELNDIEYKRDREWNEMISGLNVKVEPELHLSCSVRSFRASQVSNFINSLLNLKTEESKKIYTEIKNKYPIKLTRDFKKAKDWVRSQSRGTTRYGLIASSGGLRLKADGIFVKNPASIEEWFLNGKDDIRSSYFLEDCVTEYDIQGLEIDYSVVAWDCDFRFDGSKWLYYSFLGNKWCKVSSPENRLYLLNTYRVLLTRARQGMVIFVPYGNDKDQTRQPSYYDSTYNYLKEIGLDEI